MNEKGFVVFGVEEIIKNLEAAVGSLKGSAVRAAMRAAATVIRDEAKRNVPTRTGSLKKAIIVTTARSRKNKRVPYIGIVKIDRVAFAKNEKGKLKAVRRGKGSKSRVYKRGEIYPRNYDHLVERGADEHDLNSKKDGAPYKHHPGAKAKPYMRPAFFAKHAEALEVFRNRLKAEIVRSVTATPRKKSA